MGQRVRTAVTTQTRLRAFDRFATLGMKRSSQPSELSYFERAPQALRVRGSQIARSRAHEYFEPDDQTGRGELRQRADRLADQPEDAEVAVRRTRGQSELVTRSLDRVRRRHGVGHIEHCRDAAHDRRAGARQPGLLVLEAGLAEVDVSVDEP